MVGFLFLIVMIGTVFSIVSISPSLLNASESNQALWSDMTYRGIAGLKSAFKGYKLAHEADLPATTRIPATFNQMIPTFGFYPRSPAGTYWNYSRNTGGQPFLCLAGAVDTMLKFQGIREGATRAGAVFSTNPVCGGQVVALTPTQFPAYVSVTYYLN